MSRVIHFEFHADDCARAQQFYTDAFGWEFTSVSPNDDYFTIRTGDETTPGIDGGMMKRFDPNGHVYNTILVDDIDETIEKVRAAGGETAHEKHQVPGVGWLYYFRDTEGNVFGCLQPDMDAE